MPPTARGVPAGDLPRPLSRRNPEDCPRLLMQVLICASPVPGPGQLFPIPANDQSQPVRSVSGSVEHARSRLPEHLHAVGFGMGDVEKPRSGDGVLRVLQTVGPDGLVIDRHAAAGYPADGHARLASAALGTVDAPAIEACRKLEQSWEHASRVQQRSPAAVVTLTATEAAQVRTPTTTTAKSAAGAALCGERFPLLTLAGRAQDDLRPAPSPACNGSGRLPPAAGQPQERSHEPAGRQAVRIPGRRARPRLPPRPQHPCDLRLAGIGMAAAQTRAIHPLAELIHLQRKPKMLGDLCISHGHSLRRRTGRHSS